MSFHAPSDTRDRTIPPKGPVIRHDEENLDQARLLEFRTSRTRRSMVLRSHRCQSSCQAEISRYNGKQVMIWPGPAPDPILPIWDRRMIRMLSGSPLCAQRSQCQPTNRGRSPKAPAPMEMVAAERAASAAGAVAGADGQKAFPTNQSAI